MLGKGLVVCKKGLTPPLRSSFSLSLRCVGGLRDHKHCIRLLAGHMVLPLIPVEGKGPAAPRRCWTHLAVLLLG